MTAPPATWDAVIGQPAAVAILRDAVERDEVAHAWLLVGPEGVGQRDAARALAAALNCDHAADGEGCGTCSTCERVARGTHPAALDFEPEGATHVVDAVRSDWIPTATRTLTEGRRKVLRIAAADRMNEGAQNAFLKMLEEPPPSVVWLLEVTDESGLLDTVVSRCRRLDFVPWTPLALDELARRLEVADEQRPALVRAALGSPDRLRDLAEPDVAHARDTHLALLGRLAAEGPGAVVPVAKGLVAWARGRGGALERRHAVELEHLEEAYGVEGGRGWPPGIKQRVTKRFQRLERAEQRRALDAVLDDLAAYLRDLLVVGAGGDRDAIVNIDHLGQLQRDATRLSSSDVVAVLTAIARCREALERNGAPELQLERVLMTLALHLYRAAA